MTNKNKLADSLLQGLRPPLNEKEFKDLMDPRAGKYGFGRFLDILGKEVVNSAQGIKKRVEDFTYSKNPYIDAAVKIAPSILLDQASGLTPEGMQANAAMATLGPAIATVAPKFAATQLPSLVRSLKAVKKPTLTGNESRLGTVSEATHNITGGIARPKRPTGTPKGPSEAAVNKLLSDVNKYRSQTDAYIRLKAKGFTGSKDDYLQALSKWFTDKPLYRTKLGKIQKRTHDIKGPLAFPKNKKKTLPYSKLENSFESLWSRAETPPFKTDEPVNFLRSLGYDKITSKNAAAINNNTYVRPPKKINTWKPMKTRKLFK
jgi:hypothetical protein